MKLIGLVILNALFLPMMSSKSVTYSDYCGRVPEENEYIGNEYYDSYYEYGKITF